MKRIRSKVMVLSAAILVSGVALLAGCTRAGDQAAAGEGRGAGSRGGGRGAETERVSREEVVSLSGTLVADGEDWLLDTGNEEVVLEMGSRWFVDASRQAEAVLVDGATVTVKGFHEAPRWW